MEPASHYQTGAYWLSDSFVTYATPTASGTAYDGPATYFTTSTATAAEARGLGLDAEKYPLSSEVYSGVGGLDERGKPCKTDTKTLTVHEEQTVYVLQKAGPHGETTSEYIPISTAAAHLAERAPKGDSPGGGGRGGGKRGGGCTTHLTVTETHTKTATVVMTPEAASQRSEVPGEMNFGTQELIPQTTVESNAQGRPKPFDLFRRR